MRPLVVFRHVGFLLVLLAACMCALIPLAILLGEFQCVLHFGISAVATSACGIALFLASRQRKSEGISRRDAFGIVTIAWVLTGIFGALPYYVSGVMPNPIDAFFESISGFTTTGSSVLSSPASLPRTLLLWRALTQWLGGMGIVVLFVAVFAELGVGARYLFESEVPGPITDTIKPRIKDTSLALWRVYLLLTIAETLILIVCGLDPYDAVCHAFTTVSTGGFSTRNESLAAFPISAQVTVIVFMVLAGANFSLYLGALSRNAKNFLRDREFLSYIAMLALAGLLMAATIHTLHSDGLVSLRHGLFQVISVATTTGFATDDFNAYPPVSKVMLIALMFIGGCAGSTAGGIKVVRLAILLKVLHRGIVRMLRPHVVMPIRLGRLVVHECAVDATSGFFFFYAVVFFAATLAVAAHGIDLETTVSAVAATLGNVGPGLGKVGASSHYGHLPDSVKLILTACMVLGRLELYTVLALLVPQFWKK